MQDFEKLKEYGARIGLARPILAPYSLKLFEYSVNFVRKSQFFSTSLKGNSHKRR